jgi:ABC-2 type transport system permease protein
MKSLLKMTWMEAKLFLREPASAFFTLIFPLMMLFIYGTIFSNSPIPTPGGSENAIGNLIPSFAAMSIGIVGLMPVTITLATYRENGILRRLRTTPIHPLVVMAAQVIVLFVMTILGVLLLIAAGVLVYHVQFAGNVLSVFAGFVLGGLSFFGMGFILASVMPTARTAQIVGMVLLYPMLILSGAGWPRELMPGVVVKISSFLPLTYVVNLLRGLWIGEAWGQHITDVIVLLVMFVVGAFVSVKLFRWE